MIFYTRQGERMPTASTQTTKDKATQCPAKRPPAGVKSEKAKPNTVTHRLVSQSSETLLLHEKVVVDRVAHENAYEERDGRRNWSCCVLITSKNLKACGKKVAILQNVTTNIV